MEASATSTGILRGKKMSLFIRATMILVIVANYIVTEKYFLSKTYRIESHLLLLGTAYRAMVVFVLISGLTSVSKASALVFSILNCTDRFSQESASLVKHGLAVFSFQLVIQLMMYVYLSWLLNLGLFYVLMGIEFALFELYVLFVLFLAVTITNYLRRLNELCVQQERLYCQLSGLSIQPVRCNNTSISQSVNSLKCLENLVFLSRQFEELYDMIDEFNERFKVLFVLSVLILIARILRNSTLTLQMCLSLANTSFDANTKFCLLIIYTYIISKSYVLASIMAFVGENLEEEGKTTSDLCYSLLNKLPIDSTNELDLLIKEQLYLLINQGKCRKICLQVEGFFRLNWGILGFITSTVATYTIIITQLMLG